MFRNDSNKIVLIICRLSESGLQNYVDLTRRVKLFDGSGLSSFGGYCDEIIQRDSATSAGEDEPHGDIHVREVGRTGPGSSQNRVILRKRRQFDAQGKTLLFPSHAFARLQNAAKNIRLIACRCTKAPTFGNNHSTPCFNFICFIQNERPPKLEAHFGISIS